MYFILFIGIIFILNESSSIRLFKHKFLNKNQWSTLNKHIVSSSTNIHIRTKIDKIIYHHYDDWSYYKALQFKKRHYNKCKHISLNELYLYSNMGLLKAIKKYNGVNNFTNYATIYINGELYRGLTQLHPITNISKKDRIVKQNISDTNYANYANYTNNNKNKRTIIVGYDDWIYDKVKIKNNYYNYKNYWEYNNNEYEEFWENINVLVEPFEKYLIYSKYDSMFNIKCSNANIANRLGYSEEYIRLTLKQALLKCITPIEKKNGTNIYL
jgi:hypothetical protein